MEVGRRGVAHLRSAEVVDRRSPDFSIEHTNLSYPDAIIVVRVRAARRRNVPAAGNGLGDVPDAVFGGVVFFENFILGPRGAAMGKRPAIASGGAARALGQGVARRGGCAETRCASTV